MSRTPGMMTPKSGTPAALQSPDSGFKSLERTLKSKTKSTVAITEPDKSSEDAKAPLMSDQVETKVEETNMIAPIQEPVESKVIEDTPQLLDVNGDNEMTASMIAKSKINTEEEAKAALAERRRLAREEAERAAELERQRIEAEAEVERQRQLEEEERLRNLEEETIRLAVEQRLLEEQRLQQAIEEAQKREEIEAQKREEEVRLKAEKEEQERKSREEAEKQRIEMQEKLKQEEKEREERRKRVEAIMSRTRSKGSASNTPQKVNNLYLYLLIQFITRVPKQIQI